MFTSAIFLLFAIMRAFGWIMHLPIVLAAYTFSFHCEYICRVFIDALDVGRHPTPPHLGAGRRLDAAGRIDPSAEYLLLAVRVVVFIPEPAAISSELALC
ncbi:hypothetical protein BDV95DRAFT_561470 [Massariosphaeria phaeospora]|uniref:Uncharacterized protein n=1 Tax=Massariosphaeria phaeospora TaxID=100035 RepID=A0A7C8MJ43_9PLEO|nr:hypothetical protein BDV95DRAFT_561470 [Massariosphaeria phaeospora]